MWLSSGVPDVAKVLLLAWSNDFMILWRGRCLLTAQVSLDIISLNIEGTSVSSVKNQRSFRVLLIKPSNCRLYQGTIRFNILLGAIKENVSQDEIDQACKDANVRFTPTLH